MFMLMIHVAGPVRSWVAARTRVLLNVSGSMARPVVDFAVRGVSMRDTRYTYLDTHGMPSGGDWALQAKPPRSRRVASRRAAPRLPPVPPWDVRG